MLEINYHDLDNANKGLGICFTIMVFAANFILICLTIQKGGFLYTPRNLTIISLAFGDIFLALFGLVIFTRTRFDDHDTNLSCSTSVSYDVYMTFLIHFVYATGLIVLAAELVHRFKTQEVAIKTTANIIKSVTISAVPWVLGLIIVLPLSMPGPNKGSDPCHVHFTNERIQVTLGISVIVPAFLAVLVYLGVVAINLSPAPIAAPTVLEQSQHQLNMQSMPGQLVMNEYSEIPMAHATGPQPPVSSVSGSSHISAAEATDTHNPNFEGQAYPASPPHYPVQQFPTHPQASHENPVLQYSPQQYITQYNIMVPASGQLQYITDSAFSYPTRERKILCLIAIVHLLCVVPSAVFTLGMYVGNYNLSFTDTDTVLDWSLFWLSIFRSFITPIMFSYMIK